MGLMNGNGFFAGRAGVGGDVWSVCTGGIDGVGCVGVSSGSGSAGGVGFGVSGLDGGVDLTTCSTLSLQPFIMESYPVIDAKS